MSMSSLVKLGKNVSARSTGVFLMGKPAARSRVEFFLTLLCAPIFLTGIPIQRLMAQGQQAPSNVPTLRVTSTLVFLDVTVVDKKGQQTMARAAQT
jgi:hypothetical protein